MRIAISRLLVTAGLASVLLLAVSGCNTMEGMGQDVSALGHMLTNTAQDTAEALQDEEQQQTAEADQQQRSAQRD